MDTNPDMQEPTTTPDPVPQATQPLVENPPVATPVVEPQPVVMAAPALEMAQSPVVVEPIATVQQPAQPIQPMAQSPVFNSAPQPTMVTNNMPTTTSKKSKKMIIIIAAAVAGLIGIGIAVWLLFLNGIPLTKYTNTEGSYSIMVPTSYAKEENGPEATFTKSGTTSDNESYVKINGIDIPSGFRDALIKEIY